MRNRNSNSNNTKSTRQGKKNTSFKAVSKSAKGKHRVQNQAGVKAHFKKKNSKVNASARANCETGICSSFLKKPFLKKPRPEKENKTKNDVNLTEIDKKEYAKVRTVTIEENFEGQRVDNYLRRELPRVPKSKIYKIIRKGEVRLNKKRVKPDDKLKAGDLLRIPPVVIEERAAVFIPEKAIALIKSKILYQDENFMVINKPAGMAVHGGTRTDYGVIDVIRKAFDGEGWELCHRLDKDTSGCLVLANNRSALNEFQFQSREGLILKQYLTLVKGNWQADEMLIDTPIEKTEVSRMNAKGKFEKVVEGGEKETVSVFSTREVYSKSTLMQVVIKTGKTHQIRVHSAMQKHPVAMDDKYGDFRWNKILLKMGLPRMFLHAHIIKFKAFDELIYVSSELPEDLNIFLENLE